MKLNEINMIMIMMMIYRDVKRVHKKGGKRKREKCFPEVR